MSWAGRGQFDGKLPYRRCAAAMALKSWWSKWLCWSTQT